MTPRSFTRRGLLETLAVGAGSLAFGVDPLRRHLSEARAQGATEVPRRIIIFPIANGVADYPDIIENGATPTNYKFGRFIAPIETAGLRSETVILDNLEFPLPRYDVDYHFTGLIEVLTGAFYAEPDKGKATRESIDRYLAKKIGAKTRIGQINMGCMCDSVSYSFDNTGVAMPSNSDPLDVYSKVFGTLGGASPDALRRLARKRSALDAVAADLAAFKRRLGAEDARRAEAQLTAIRDMERRLSLAVGANCKGPDLSKTIDYKSSMFVPETMRAFIDLAVSAMACDQTRVVLMHSYLREYHPPRYKCPWSPANSPNDDFHGLSHDTPGDKYESFARAKTFFFQLAAELANKLKQIPEAGATMLDHTIIFIPTEIGRGHTSAGLQFLTIGGRGLGVKTGQYMWLGTDRQKGKGVAHHRLLVALLNALGVPDLTFGDDKGSGPLPGFLS